MKKLLALLLPAIILLSACTPGVSDDTVGTRNGAESGDLGLLLEGEIAGEITVSAFESIRYESFLNEAAEKFETLYPGTSINVVTFMAGPEVQTMEQDGQRVAMYFSERNVQDENDYIFRTGNEIMSGQGADIFAMDILPFDRYARSGYLEDLSGYLEADSGFNRDDYMANVLDAVRLDGRQYILPIGFSFDVITYNDELVDGNEIFGAGDPMSLEKLLSVGAEYLGRNQSETSDTPVALIYSGRRQLFSNIFQADYGSFVDAAARRADFDSQKFADVLNLVQSLETDGLIHEGVFALAAARPGGRGASVSGGGQSGERIMVPPSPDEIAELMNVQSLFGTRQGNMLLQLLDTESQMQQQYFSPGTTLGENNSIGTILANAEGDVEARITQSFAMNANSENKRLAWEFLKFLLSDEMQSSTSNMSIPANRNAMAEKARYEVASGVFGQGLRMGGVYGQGGASGQGVGMRLEEDSTDAADIELTENQLLVLNEYLELIRKFGGMINAWNPIDGRIMDLVNEETEQFFAGEKSAQDAASALQSRVTLYLNE